MRPDRIVLGECRGAELREVLLALNTGHRGGLTTVHANSAADVPARLIAMGALAGLTPQAVELHAAAAFDAVVHMAVSGGARRVAEIGVVGLASRGALEVRPAATVGADSDVTRGEGWGQLLEAAGLTAEAPRMPSVAAVGPVAA